MQFEKKRLKLKKMCLLSLLKDLTSPKITGNSESVVLFGKNKKYGHVAVKITLKDDVDDDSLSTERKIYNFIKRKILQKSCHFLASKTTGKCSLDAIPTLMEEVHILRGKRIWNTISEKLAQSSLKEYPYKIQTEKDQELFYSYLSTRYSNLYSDLYYVVTPFVSNVTLYSMYKQGFKFPLSFVTTVLIQMAQAMCTAQFYKLSHNDLHLQNVLIQKHKTKKTTPF